MGKIMALSHSRINDFDQCPLKFKLKYIDKLPEFKMDAKGKSPHLIKGEKIHKYLEDFVNHRKEGRDTDENSLDAVENGKEFADRVIDEYGSENVFAELKLAVDKNWEPCDWFAPQTYMRAIVDFSAYGENQSEAIDWKTGKFVQYTPESGFGQLELTAGFIFALKPEIERVKTRYAYVEHRKAVNKEYNNSDFIPIRQYFDAKSEQINAEDKFLAKKNRFCNWCEATKSMCPHATKEDL
jgi:CRISPR/Cas system-associated exonuclease Cas4 (RecB family)